MYTYIYISQIPVRLQRPRPGMFRLVLCTTSGLVPPLGVVEMCQKAIRQGMDGRFTIWLFNIAMESGPFIDGLPINSMVIFHGYVTVK